MANKQFQGNKKKARKQAFIERKAKKEYHNKFDLDKATDLEDFDKRLRASRIDTVLKNSLESAVWIIKKK